MAFGHSLGPSGLLDFVFHALRALKLCFVACEGRWVKNVTEEELEEFRSIGLGFLNHEDKFYLLNLNFIEPFALVVRMSINFLCILYRLIFKAAWKITQE